ncbi:MAG: HAD family hydrolase [Desulfoplanes sp.]|nr:HAD family hydrolase [Desulfoplanes sp.]
MMMKNNRSIYGDAALAGVQGIIFDCDGVLFDSREVNRRYYNELRFALNLPALTEDELDYAHMHTVAQALTRIIPEERMPEMYLVRERLKYHAFIPYLTPAPGVYELLDTLRSRNIRCAVNTNRLDTMETILTTFDLRQYFFPVITAAKVTFAKPHAEGIHAILATWGVAKSGVRYIGDSAVDEVTARNAQVDFWAYRNEQLLADVHVHDFWDLRRRFLESALGSPRNPGRNGT